MILSGRAIKEKLNKTIFIDPYKESRINPNSYNLTLSNVLLEYTKFPLDMRKLNETKTITIPETGLELKPNVLYLGRTAEYTKTFDAVPMLEGRSSIGRLGLSVHITAGFGDVGFEGYWTLEMHCIHPVIIYPGVEICQIFYHTIEGEYDLYSNGKYQKNTGIQPSLLYKEFNKE